ncbi:MAG: penicillin-binding protein activator, partial [Candidatus Puniceispirillaceae bacterium]
PQTSAPDIIPETEIAAAPQPAQTGYADADGATGADEAVDVASLAPSVTGSIDGLIEMIETEAEAKEKAAEDTVAQPPAQTGVPGSEAAAEDAASVASDETQAVAEVAPDQATLDQGSAVGNIIWNLEAANRGRAAPEPEPVVPVGPDPSLATEALEAAFAMLARRDQGLETGGFIMPPKADGIMRIALLVPKSGENAVLGNELQRGAELALFSLRNSQIELLVFDTVEKGAGVAAREAVVAEADIIVGPLFSDAVVSARQVAATHGVPMLALSNNTAIAGRGSWLFGYLPEQQVDILLGHALTAGRNKVGIIAADDVFGQRLARHAQKRLGQFGLDQMQVAQTVQTAIAGDSRIQITLDDEDMAKLTPTRSPLALRHWRKFVPSICSVRSGTGTT